MPSKEPLNGPLKTKSLKVRTLKVLGTLYASIMPTDAETGASKRSLILIGELVSFEQRWRGRDVNLRVVF